MSRFKRMPVLVALAVLASCCPQVASTQLAPPWSHHSSTVKKYLSEGRRMTLDSAVEHEDLSVTIVSYDVTVHPDITLLDEDANVLGIRCMEDSDTVEVTVASGVATLPHWRVGAMLVWSRRFGCKAEDGKPAAQYRRILSQPVVVGLAADGFLVRFRTLVLELEDCFRDATVNMRHVPAPRSQRTNANANANASTNAGGAPPRKLWDLVNKRGSGSGVCLHSICCIYVLIYVDARLCAVSERGAVQLQLRPGEAPCESLAL